jgi:chemotaxis protein MotB
MSARRGGGRRRGGAAEQESEERWLLTYADMITLLMALFMVLFSISSVNISKFKTLQNSLREAFSGSVLPGGKALLQSGSESTRKHSPATSEIPAIVPLSPNIPKPMAISRGQLEKLTAMQVAATKEQNDFAALQARLRAYAQAHGFAKQVNTVIDRRGLVVRVLTDKLLFDSGQATLKPAGLPLLEEMASLLNVDQAHPIVVEGHTDDIPIASAEFPSNWELSTARATTVVRFLISRGVDRSRLGAAGYADLHPLATNGTDVGRAQNRRVEIVFERLNPVPDTATPAPPQAASTTSGAAAGTANPPTTATPQKP